MSYSLVLNSPKLFIRATYIPEGDSVRVKDFSLDSDGIIPDGEEERIITLQEARQEWHDRIKGGFEVK
jgi:hypothetical protein